jgi:hypothetical protein
MHLCLLIITFFHKSIFPTDSNSYIWKSVFFLMKRQWFLKFSVKYNAFIKATCVICKWYKFIMIKWHVVKNSVIYFWPEITSIYTCMSRFTCVPDINRCSKVCSFSYEMNRWIKNKSIVKIFMAYRKSTLVWTYFSMGEIILILCKGKLQLTI